MKKIAKYFFAALASAAAISCVQEMNVVEKPSVELTGDSYVFTATIGADTKTVLDEETMTPMWLGGEDGNEYITVMDTKSVNTYVAENVTEPTRSVEFVMAEDGGPGLTEKEVMAVSPAGDWRFAKTDTEAAKTVTATVSYPASQYSTEGSYDPAAPVAVAYNPDVTASTDLHFNNVSALLKFQIHGDSDPVRSVKIYALGGEALAGTMNVTMTFEKEQEGEETEGEEAEEEEEKDFISVVAAEGASDCVELVEYTGMELEKEVTYYIAVAPAVLKEGIGIQFNNNEVQTLTISKEVVLERSKVYDLGVFSYDNEMDDNWYLIGNFTEGNDNSVGKLVFEAAGDNLLAVKKVTIKEGQEFKIYNPGKGLTLLPIVEGTLETGNWVAIDEGEGFMTAPAGEYDIYIDYVDEEITGVALMTAGAAAPEFLVPELGYYTWIDDSQVEYGGREQHFAICLDEQELVMAESYDANMAEMPAEYHDPTMIGKWNILGVYTDVQYVPTHATAGEIRCQSIEASSGVGPLSAEEGEVKYHLVRYSDLIEGSMNVLSTAQMYDKDGNEIPVLDADGNPVQVWIDWREEYVPAVYSGIGGLSSFDENLKSIPIPIYFSKTDLDFSVPVPTTGQFVWNSNLAEYDEETGEEVVIESCMKMFDLGITEPGVIRIASYYDQLSADPMTGETYEWADPRLAGTWLTEMRFDKYEIVPTGINGGEIRIYNESVSPIGKTVTEYFLIYYSNYTYKSMIALHSPSEIVDSEGNAIPVEGTDAYWQGLGIEEIYYWAGGVSNPVGMYDAELYGMAGEAIDAPTTPDGAQWFFNWEGMAAAFGIEELPTVIDLGVASEGFFLAIDQSVLYGGETDFFEYMSSPKYVVTPDPENPEVGKITMIGLDMYGDEVVSDFATYEYFGGTMCHFVCESYMIDAYAEIVREPFEITPNGAVVQ